MSADEQAAKEIVETLKDGQKGYAASAEKLADSERPEWAATMRRLEQQRVQFAQEIVAMGRDYGDDVDESGSALAAAHRGWLSLKDALTGDKPSGVLDAAVQGEDHAVWSTRRLCRATSARASVRSLSASTARSSRLATRSRLCRPLAESACRTPQRPCPRSLGESGATYRH